MPVVHAYIKKPWVPPTGTKLEDYTAEQQLMHELIKRVREWVAFVVGASDGTTYKIEDVALYVHDVHSDWSENVPDLTLDIQPSDIDQPRALREQRRWNIQNHVRLLVGDYFYGRQERLPDQEYPSHDIECRTIDASGTSTDKSGKVTAEWGKPGGEPSLLGDNASA